MATICVSETAFDCIEPEPQSCARPTLRPRFIDPLAPLQRRAAAGDSGALEQLLSLLRPHLWRAIVRSLGHRADVEDCLQEALVALTRALPSFRGDSSVRQYALCIAIRHAHCARRTQRTRLLRLNRVSELEQPLREQGAAPHDHSDGERRLLALYELLSELPENQARALVMRAVLDYSVGEIARFFDVPVNTVRSRVRLARSLLRLRIDGDRQLSELFERND